MPTARVGTPSRQSNSGAPRAARVTGYVVAATINMVFIWLVNVSPGLQWLPFLSDDFFQVVGIITFSFAVSLVINIVYITFDPVWMKRLGDALNAAVGFIVLVQILRVFPFDLDAQWAFMETPLVVLLVVACIGTAVGTVVGLVMFVRALSTGTAGR